MPTKNILAQPVAPKSVKKTSSKVVGKKSLVHASNAHSFWVTNGIVLNNLAALGEAFGAMDSATYKHHVTETKNDFAVWVDAVLKDSVCAKELKTAKTKTQSKTVIAKHLKNYQL